MSCADLMETLQMYVDGTTDPEESRRAEDHLAECEDCRHRVEGWRRAARVVAGLEPVMAPEGFADRVMESIRREAAVPRRVAIHDSHESLTVSWTWAAAAGLMIALGLVLWLGPEGSAAANVARGLLQFLASLLGR